MKQKANETTVIEWLTGKSAEEVVTFGEIKAATIHKSFGGFTLLSSTDIKITRQLSQDKFLRFKSSVFIMMPFY